MDRLKTFRKYIIWLILFYLFTMLCTYVGLNAMYTNIENGSTLPEEVKVDIAQATSVNGRIYGEIKAEKENNLNGKYLKINIYNRLNKLTGTKYLKIEDVKLNEPKKFMVNFTAENIKSFDIAILDDTPEVSRDKERAIQLFGKRFTDEELKTYTIITLILYCMFA